MGRQTENISESKGARYECDYCGLVDYLPAKVYGTVDQAARFLGWRIGPNGTPVWCPECTGHDEGYWDRKTLVMADMAGIAAGSTAWGEP